MAKTEQSFLCVMIHKIHFMFTKTHWMTLKMSSAGITLHRWFHKRCINLSRCRIWSANLFENICLFFHKCLLTHTESCPSGLWRNRSHIHLFRASICPNPVAMENKPYSGSVGNSQTGWEVVSVFTMFENWEPGLKWSCWFSVVNYC